MRLFSIEELFGKRRTMGTGEFKKAVMAGKCTEEEFNKKLVYWAKQGLIERDFQKARVYRKA